MDTNDANSYKTLALTLTRTTPWETIKVKTIYHTPKVLDEDPMDFIVLSKNDEEQTIKVRVYSTTPREINIHKNSLWGKVLVKKRLF